MRWKDIIEEKRLPLRKGGIGNARGSYAAFVVTMHPDEFLRLTASESDRAMIAAAPFPDTEEDYSRWGDDSKDFGRFPTPFLNVEWPSGRVMGHEGRHRAMMVLRQGGEVFPVIIYLRSQVYQEVTYEKSNWDTDEETQHVERFEDIEEAMARVTELKAWNDKRRAMWGEDGYDELEPVSYSGVKINSLGGHALKGSPAHDNPKDPWEKKPFQISDMPKQLLAQHDQSISVSGYRVGLVKGYRHFR
jgi:hypothetical protein